MSGKKFIGVKQCAYCGTQAPIGATFCPRCGEPFNLSQTYDKRITVKDIVTNEGENQRVGEITPISRPPTVSETSTQILYEGTIRGLVTKGLMPIHTSVLIGPYPNINFANSTFVAPPLYQVFSEVCFVVRLEENLEGGPDEILVLSSNFGYFGKGDEVILQGKLFKTYLSYWSGPMYLIVADHYYNESLRIGDGGLTEGKRLFKGMIRGSVTKESRTGFLGNDRFYGNYFVIRLEESIGIGGIPDEILVHCHKQGYFGKGDKVILQGEITEKVLKKWERPSYIVQADHFYNESLKIGEAESMRSKRVLHRGMIRGTVTRESVIRADGAAFAGTYFAMKLEENFAEIPDEILVQTFHFGYFGKGDKVILEGEILETNLKHWKKPMYLISAKHFYNESLQIDVVMLMSGKQVFRGTIRGTVTRESKTKTSENGDFAGTYFAMKLEENIGIKGLPDEILVESKKVGYFGIGDKVILQGEILETNLKHWKKPMYLIVAEHYYEESLQIGN
ncbi:MAG: zinc ribbon domain-containing protein [Candidatus Freyarchaeum deiterrae]